MFTPIGITLLYKFSLGGWGGGGVNLLVLPLVTYVLPPQMTIFNMTTLFIPPAYEVCRGVYSFRLSIRSFLLPSVRPSGVNILRQSFA